VLVGSNALLVRDIQSLQARVDNNTAAIQLNTAAISANTVLISGNTQSISLINDEIDAIDVDIGVLEASTTVIEGDIALINLEISSLQVNVTANTNDISSNTVSINTLELETNDNTEDISTLNDTTTQNSLKIATLEAYDLTIPYSYASKVSRLYGNYTMDSTTNRNILCSFTMRHYPSNVGVTSYQLKGFTCTSSSTANGINRFLIPASWKKPISGDTFLFPLKKGSFWYVASVQCEYITNLGWCLTFYPSIVNTEYWPASTAFTFGGFTFSVMN
jgi:hypothetical protein